MNKIRKTINRLRRKKRTKSENQTSNNVEEDLPKSYIETDAKTIKECLNKYKKESIKFVYRENNKEDREVSLKNNWVFIEGNSIRGYEVNEEVNSSKNSGPFIMGKKPTEFSIDLIKTIIEPECKSIMNNRTINRKNHFGAGGKKYRRRKNKSKKQTRKKRKQPKKHRRR